LLHLGQASARQAALRWRCREQRFRRGRTEKIIALATEVVSTTEPEEAAAVQFNTTHAGYNPIGEAPSCFQDVKNDPNKPGCGYDSLNVGAKSYVNAPYAGTDVNSTSVYRSHGNANYGAPFVALSPDSVGWAGYRPLGKIVLGP
jgi:hypothetical protein